MTELAEIRLLVSKLEKLDPSDSLSLIAQTNVEVQRLLARVNGLPKNQHLTRELVALNLAFEALLGRCHQHQQQLETAIATHCAYAEGIDAYSRVSTYQGQ